jgi:ABC-type microcin C transport system duplicated ATPase subunit YejF
MSKKNLTTIQLSKSVVKELKNIQKYPRETYNETILNLIKTVKESKKKKQYDEFLHTIHIGKNERILG